MISQTLLSLLRHVCDPGTNGVGDPELDQQAVKVPPFLINDLPNRLLEGVKRVDANTLKAFGFDGSENGVDPLYARRMPPRRATRHQMRLLVVSYRSR